MKYWIIICIFLVGSALTIVGGIIEMKNVASAAWLLNISLTLQIIAVVLLIVKFVKSRKTDGLKK